MGVIIQDGTPASGGSDLCTLADAKASCHVTDSSQDALLSRLITAVSAEIRKETGREFGLAAAGSRIFFLNNTARVYPQECVSISGITDSSGNTILATDYDVIPGDEFTRWVEFASRRTGWVTVSGTFGYSSIPKDVEDIALKAVRNQHEIEHSALIGPVADGSFVEGPRYPIVLSRALKEALAFYKRKHF